MPHKPSPVTIQDPQIKTRNSSPATNKGFSTMASLEQTWGHERLVASAYDFAVHNPLVRRIGAFALWGLDARLLMDYIARLRETTAGSRVLDVPCGGGLAFASLQPNHALDYVAFDFSPVMLERAQQSAQQLGLKGIQFQQGDVGALPYEAQQFDLCQCYNGLHCFPDPQKAIQEMARVLKVGGTLRTTLVVKGAGTRYDAMICLFQWRGWFGPTCTRAALEGWLKDANLKLTDHQQSGALWMFEAVKQTPTP
ncbi:Methlytransferase, UbiE/COQ5 family [gamma proteobacterium HdN1]|nr:Methlytransferase, UbiE/COQ5 family [gamma proteobacterium HdN1]